jgi:hypothetical protein
MIQNPAKMICGVRNQYGKAVMLGAGDVRLDGRSRTNGLFDRDGLPWTSRIQWGLLLFWVGAILIVFAPLVGIYLGLWLISRQRSKLSLILYVALFAAFAFAVVFPFPANGQLSMFEMLSDVSVVVLWLVSAFTLRREVRRYYSDREGVPLSLNPVLTAMFGPWYIGGHLRANFPLNSLGKTGSGVLKLVN